MCSKKFTWARHARLIWALTTAYNYNSRAIFGQLTSPKAGIGVYRYQFQVGCQNSRLIMARSGYDLRVSMPLSFGGRFSHGLFGFFCFAFNPGDNRVPRGSFDGAWPSVLLGWWLRGIKYFLIFNSNMCVSASDCDPIWQVTSRSSEMGFPWRAVSAFTFYRPFYA